MAFLVLKPKLQVALDLTNLEAAIRVGEMAIEGGCDILEAGTPLIKSVGIESVRRLRHAFPRTQIVADMKIIDAGRIEAKLAAEAGADIVTVLGVADDSTIRDVVSEAKLHGVSVCGDLITIKDPVKRAIELESLGVDMVCVHIGVDVQKSRGITVKELINEIRLISRSISIPVCVAGGIKHDIVKDLIEAGARIIIVGSAITAAPDPKTATKEIKEIIKSTM